VVLAACSSSSGRAAPKNTTTPKGTTAPAGCTAEAAQPARQALISASGWDVRCAKARVGTSFFFINDDTRPHTVTARPPSPQTFDAILPKKTSTYQLAVKRAGTYVVIDRRGNHQMTLIVTS
jgi:plastocyanin